MTMIIDRRPGAHPAPRVLRAAGRRLGDIHRAWMRRRRFRTLLDLDDRMLDDIGVTRGEVERHAGLPLTRNAALELQASARARRRRDLG